MKRVLIALVCLLIHSLPSTAGAAFGVKFGHFSPSNPNAYGHEAYLFDQAYSADPNSEDPRKGWTAIDIYFGRRWENGAGLDIGTRLPTYSIRIEPCVPDGTGWCYEQHSFAKLVWPIVYLSGRYTASSSIAPYVGGGIGIYQVIDPWNMTTLESVPAAHVFVGFEFFHNRFTHVNLEVRYERTSYSEELDAYYHDGGDLGGLLISGGISW